MKRLFPALFFPLAFLSSFALTAPGGSLTVRPLPAEGLLFSWCNATDTVPVATVLCGDVTPLGEPSLNFVSYEMVVGKRHACTNQFVAQDYLLSSGDTLSLRVYTDGFAWKNPGKSEIRFASPLHSWLQDWTDCYEGFFPLDSPQTPGRRIGYPALFEFRDGCFALISESGITVDEAGVSMYARGDDTFSLVPDGPENGGWQTVIVGSLADVVESTLIFDNSAPSLLSDTSWIHPGLAAWVYWAYNHGSNDMSIIRRYVDLAAELGLPYVLIDAEWDEMKDGYTVEDAVAYAVRCGVHPMIWYNSSVGWVNGAPGPKFRLNTPESLEKEFAWCESIGVTGVKIDFFSGDTNLNMKFMADLLEAGARHHLTVNFHGSPLPRGWQRTYPNFITTESVYGAEWYNNVPTFTDRAAAHNATLPFTRNVIGSMDYTPCAFTDSQHPHITTDAHELALTALYESGIQHLADRPESFLAQPQVIRDYLTNLPAAWTDTRFVAGYPGKYAVLARRSGDTWWISGINGTDESLTIPLDFSRLGLDSSPLSITMIEDDFTIGGKGWNVTYPSSLPATVTLLPRGGVVMVASPEK